MDGPRFDTWTRRHFGLAAGEMATVMLAFGPLWEADAKKGKKGKKKRKRCRKLEKPCGKKKRCCKGSRCAHSASYGRKVCCHTYGQPCPREGFECCGDLACGMIAGLPPEDIRCCGGPGRRFGAGCKSDDDCCLFHECNTSTGECEVSET
ncbi:MAG: hypothetical protein K0S78_5773 [Thermomicrobiales bacterium]|jgi:hypothetical protein|nr:hypothetical protein [Thermomicrobiales bacterium]MDF3039840.1 hypothetical protein [Thermomicrobiales bacterium]